MTEEITVVRVYGSPRADQLEPPVERRWRGGLHSGHGMGVLQGFPSHVPPLSRGGAIIVRDVRWPPEPFETPSHEEPGQWHFNGCEDSSARPTIVEAFSLPLLIISLCDRQRYGGI